MNAQEFKRQVEAIDRAFVRLTRACSSSSNWDAYIDLIEREERGHRRFCPASVKPALPLSKAVRQYAVFAIFSTQIASAGQDKPFKPTAENYFETRKSRFAAWALWSTHGEYIAKEFSPAVMRQWLEEIDYAQLMKDRQEWKEAA